MIRITAGDLDYEVDPTPVSDNPLYAAQILRDAANNLARRLETR